MRNAKTSNIEIFLAAQALGAVYQQPIRAQMLSDVRDASAALGEKVQQMQEVAQRIQADHEDDPAKAREQVRELELSTKEVQVPDLDMDAVRATDPALTGPQWEALEAIFEDEALPQDLPHREVLVAAGYETLDALPDDLTEIDGIADARAKEIRAALE